MTYSVEEHVLGVMGVMLPSLTPGPSKALRYLEVRLVAGLMEGDQDGAPCWPSYDPDDRTSGSL